MLDNRLRYIVRELEYKINQQCPDAVVRVSYDTFEDIDALIRVYEPGSQMETLDETTVDWAYNILLDEGYNIVVLVYDLTQLLQPSRGEERQGLSAVSYQAPVAAFV